MRLTGLGMAAVVVATCAGNPPPVPVAADPGSLALLAGRWVGEYRGNESGRAGSIVFELSAAGDSATGEVVMIPRGLDRPLRGIHPEDGPVRPAPPTPEGLRIAFVRAAHGIVTGALEPYRDPECGCALRTTFSGRIVADTIAGTFETIHAESGRRTSGEWRVERSRR